MMDKQVEYYRRRALEYEKVYEKEERQQDLEELKKYVCQISKAKSVLEIGCGTGYWSELIAQNAKSLWASDINKSMLELARQKKYACPTNLNLLDYTRLSQIISQFDLIFGGFVISHIKKANLQNFLQTLFEKLNRGGELVFIDNLFVSGNSTPISRMDKMRNTYQERFLEDGSSYEVLKNYYSDQEWKEALREYGNFEIKKLDYFFLIKIRDESPKD